MVIFCIDGVLIPPDSQRVIHGKVPISLIEAHTRAQSFNVVRWWSVNPTGGVLYWWWSVISSGVADCLVKIVYACCWVVLNYANGVLTPPEAFFINNEVVCASGLIRSIGDTGGDKLPPVDVSDPKTIPILKFQQWMSRFLHWWRTQQNAIRNANRKTSWIIKTLNAHCDNRICLESYMVECFSKPLGAASSVYMFLHMCCLAIYWMPDYGFASIYPSHMSCMWVGKQDALLYSNWFFLMWKFFPSCIRYEGKSVCARKLSTI